MGSPANQNLGEIALVWSNGASAFTIKASAALAPVDNARPLELFVVNPSTQSDLTVSLYRAITINAVTRYFQLDSFNVPAAVAAPNNDIYNPDQALAVALRRRVIGSANSPANCGDGGLFITATNNLALDGSGGFTARLELRSL
jgi:hypothetical protein